MGKGLKGALKKLGKQIESGATNVANEIGGPGTANAISSGFHEAIGNDNKADRLLNKSKEQRAEERAKKAIDLAWERIRAEKATQNATEEEVKLDSIDLNGDDPTQEEIDAQYAILLSQQEEDDNANPLAYSLLTHLDASHVSIGAAGTASNPVLDNLYSTRQILEQTNADLAQRIGANREKSRDADDDQFLKLSETLTSLLQRQAQNVTEINVISQEITAIENSYSAYSTSANAYEGDNTHSNLGDSFYDLNGEELA